jgi:hypothetical protein
MSRSYRKRPFEAICGSGSAKGDKIVAHRGERAAVKRALHTALLNNDYENFLAPHRYECTWNEVYAWGRDGNQRYCGLTEKDWNRYIRANSDPDYLWYQCARYITWPPEWYKHMMRK